MPTGYTDMIGKGATFEQFVMQCARGMGACIMMRDEPWDKPIPERFEPSDYHSKKLIELEEELKMLRAMTLEQCEAAALIAYGGEITSNESYLREKLELRDKYTAMLTKVKAWKPPTHDHVGFKDFMIEQITGSIDFDCNTEFTISEIKKLRKLSGEEWRDQREKKLLYDIDYHTKENILEMERTEGRNAWIKALRESLQTTTQRPPTR